jgi:repressor LexA
MSKPLTYTQARVLDFIRQHMAIEQRPPTRAEIAQHFGYASPNAAQCHIEALAKRGAIAVTGGKSRGIFVMDTAA